MRYGKTTDALRRALDIAKQGNQVFYYVHSHAMVQYVVDLLVELATEAGMSHNAGWYGIVGLPGAITVRSMPTSSYAESNAYRRREEAGHRPTPIGLYDHHVIDCLLNRQR